MSDRVCVRGCKQRDVHFATCDGVGVGGHENTCTGCAPREARDGVLICAGCYGRARRLIRDVDDMLGRLDSLADPMKATPTDKQPGGGGSVEAPAPVDADILDAITDVSRTLVSWGRFTGRRTIDDAFDDIANDRDDILAFAEGWLDRTPEVDGIRWFWTVADAMAKWGPERRKKGEPEWVDDVTAEEAAAVPEWGDALLNRADAERIVPGRTLRRWVQQELVTPVGTSYFAGVRTVLFRRSELLQVKERMTDRVGRPRATRRGGAA